MKSASVDHVRGKSRMALVLVDVINHFEFPDGKRLLRHALPTVRAISRLKSRARRAGLATIYVNDNFGQWRSDAKTLLAYCLREGAPGRRFVHPIRPDDEDYIILKPMHSAFYQTPLDLLLRFLGTTSIVLAGIATNSCIVCSAHDADMRALNLIVPSDCCAARTKREHDQALQHIANMTGARVLRSASIRFSASERSRKLNG